jgi:hypothetical protein
VNDTDHDTRDETSDISAEIAPLDDRSAEVDTPDDGPESADAENANTPAEPPAEPSVEAPSEPDAPPAPVRRTIVIGDDTGDLPGVSAGGPIDPLLAGPPGHAAVDRGDETGLISVRPVGQGHAHSFNGWPDDVDVEPPTPSEPPIRTVVIGGDDLPDATYTVPAPGKPGTESTVRPKLDPRIHARRTAVRRAAGRRRLWFVVGGSTIVLLALGALGVLASPLFDVETINVKGATHTSEEELDEVLDGLRGKPILTADLGKYEKRLESLPWVKYATITMQFPHTLHVQVAERTAVAAFQSADARWRVIDSDGRVVEVVAGRPVDYVAIIGPAPDSIAGESAGGDYARVAQFALALPPALRPAVRHFEMDADRQVTLVAELSEGGTTDIELCAAKDLNVQQLVSLTAFVDTRIDRNQPPPERINACQPELITTTVGLPDDSQLTDAADSTDGA